jgi:hypothetical protein
MARETREHRTIVHTPQDVGLASALREAADLLDAHPEDYETKGAYIAWVDGVHHVVLPLAGRDHRVRL